MTGLYFLTVKGIIWFDVIIAIVCFGANIYFFCQWLVCFIKVFLEGNKTKPIFRTLSRYFAAKEDEKNFKRIKTIALSRAGNDNDVIDVENKSDTSNNEKNIDSSGNSKAAISYAALLPTKSDKNSPRLEEKEIKSVDEFNGAEIEMVKIKLKGSNEEDSLKSGEENNSPNEPHQLLDDLTPINHKALLEVRNMPNDDNEFSPKTFDISEPKRASTATLGEMQFMLSEETPE